jgi:hypothetical protein
MNPVLDGLGFWNPLEEQPRSDACGIDAGVRGPLLFGWQCAVEGVPVGEAVGRWGTTWSSTSHQNRVTRSGAAHSNVTMELPDRRHGPTVATHAAHAAAW